MRPKLLSLLTFFSILVLAAAPAEARRVALIIGNNNYSALSKLENPVPDAKAIAGVLKAHGYEVFEHYDITRADLLDALETSSKPPTSRRPPSSTTPATAWSSPARTSSRRPTWR